MKIKYVRQTLENNCGQACVSMITRIEIKRVMDLMGKRGKTTGVDLRSVLQYYDYDFSPTYRVSKDDPRVLNNPVQGIGHRVPAIITLRPDGRSGGHYVVAHAGMVLDPGENLFPWNKWIGFVNKYNWHLTSYFMVWKKK